MPNLNLPTNITPGTTATFEADVEAAWAELNSLSRFTGLRDITSMLTNGWTASTVRVLRDQDRTYWEFFNLDGTAATSNVLLTFTDTPLMSFRASAGVESALFRGDAGVDSVIRVSPQDIRVLVGYKSTPSTIIGFDHRCSQAWPTTLPGTAV